jgi:hypothetical protein
VDCIGCPELLTHSLGTVSPAVVSLDVGSLQRCVPNFSSLLKGGGTNRWSNADLSVAYARLASGRAVEGHIVRDEAAQRPTAANGPKGAPARSGSFVPGNCAVSVACADPARFERVRGEVLAGMGAAFLPRGTAQPLLGTVRTLTGDLQKASGKPWGVYAKTGTSEREIGVVAAVDHSLRPTRRGRRRVAVPEVSFTLMLLECAPGAGTATDTLGCATLPPLGQPVHGYVLHLWVDGVTALHFGSDAGRLYAEPRGRALLERLVRNVEAGP